MVKNSFSQETNQTIISRLNCVEITTLRSHAVMGTDVTLFMGKFKFLTVTCNNL